MSNKKHGCCHGSEAQQNKSAAGGHGSHKGHKWMMIACCAAMLAVPLYVLFSQRGGLGELNMAWVMSSMVPLLFCLVGHGALMALMMRPKKGEKKQPGKVQSALPAAKGHTLDA